MAYTLWANQTNKREQIARRHRLWGNFMSVIVDRRDHFRALQNAASRLRAANRAKASSEISGRPRDLAKRTTRDQWAAGMPRSRHPLTVDLDSSRPSEATIVPPKPSITSLQEDVMEPSIVRTVRTSQEFATSETTFLSDCVPMELMQDPNDVIAARLKALRKELGERAGIQGGYNQTQFAEEIGQTKSTYNPFETGKRSLTFEVACAIRRRFQVPVDWLFFGDMPKIDDKVLFRLGAEPRAPVRVRRTASQK